jgi:hypothetical protein
VDDALGVGGLEHLAQLAEQAADAAGAEPAVALQQRVQRDAADVLHDDARALRVVQRGVVQRHRVVVLEVGHQLHFAVEALAEQRVLGDVVVHDLDDHLPAEVNLAGEVHPAHAALAEQPDGLVLAQEHAPDHAVHPRVRKWVDLPEQV